MGHLINRKKEKVALLLDELGEKSTEEVFACLYKTRYPEDWKRIVERWQIEESEAKPGKGHPMQQPDVYMKEMFRNGMSRYRRNKTKSN